MSEDATVVKPLNVLQRINEIKKLIPYLKKDKEVSGAGTYMAVTHDAVTAATREHFVALGVLVVPRELSSVTVDSTMVTGKGNPIIRFEAKYRVDFVNVDDPADLTSVELTAHALDQGDKAPGKALSYATKSAVLKVLQIETGVDDESREATKPAKPDPNAPKEGLGAHSATTGAGEGMEPERLAECNKIFSRLVDFMDTQNVDEAEKLFYGIEDADEKVYVWSKLKVHKKFCKELSALHASKKEQANG